MCSSNAYRFDSILNVYGQYGSSTSSYSIRNSFSSFGSSFSAYSAYNSFAAYPPIIYNSAGTAQAYLTKNVLLSPRIDPDLLINYLRELGSASVGSNAILMGGPISYSTTGRSTGSIATLNVERITSYRPVGTTSNALYLRLYATSSEYISGAFVGYRLVEIPLGTSMGGYVYNKISVNGVLAAPPSGNYNIVMVLVEWNGSEYIIVDWGNFPNRESFGIIESAPVILTQPSSATILNGGNVTFTASASGTPAPTYQWKKDGSLLAGATSSTYSIRSATTSDAGSYTAVVTNSAGSATSNAAILTVTVTAAATAPRLYSLAVRTALEANQILIVGFNMSGGAKNVLLRAAGPTLGAFGVPETMVDPKLDLYSGSTLITSNDNWGGSPSLAATFTSAGAFAYASTTSLDAALVASINGGRTAHVYGPAAGAVLVEGYDVGSGDAQRFTSLSARNRVGTGANILIAGFSLSGEGKRNLLIRAVGPTLGVFGVPSVLSDPKLEIYEGSTKIGENDNWAATLSTTFSSVGAFGLTAGSKDAAITVSLPAGGYTVQVSGADGGVGEALVEIYELP